ncbi:hypothetical protein KO02_10045 [Sphingobacterium sp. ML3W]|uniref:YobI family P-loop NTPase n=1 Tax=Sphingobacterium sp. ML3W TaxID=1538644 RepID=UPI0004F719F5|nr:ATP-binding protein [Sphingobacterium sp. ML3W]AIM36996.1 hypothetical protein KO02_10045 [Sphingobacterium sp. ML3W]
MASNQGTVTTTEPEFSESNSNKQKNIRPSNVIKKLKYLKSWLNREWRAFYHFFTQIPLKIKIGISKTLIRIGERLSKSTRLLDAYLTQHSFNPNFENYEDLAPIDYADDERKYTNMLLWSLKNPKVTNVAITGPYGSGKSSVIRTFQKRHPEFRSVNVSLASFDENKDDDGEWRNKVELSVLQQLIYHEKSNSLPDSRFAKIRTISWYNRLAGTIFLGTLILSYLYITKTDYFNKLKFIDVKTKSILDVVFPTLLIFGSMYLLYKLYRTIRNLRFTKLSVVSADAEISDGEIRSVFNKHLDEIIYFFESTRIKLVVIEDLDRFNDTEIFTKLREINILINNSKQVKHRVTFIYAVRDNIFENNDRTKFFEVIIPVIPIISVSNAGDALSSKLSSIIPDKPISQELSKAVSLYIQDMRMLLNITNEFNLYSKQLSNDLNHEKLLSLIIFKNLHPEDFSDLHRGKGMIIKVIDKKRKYITEQKEKNNKDIAALQNDIKVIQSIKIKDISELRSLYLYKAISKLPHNGFLDFDGKKNPSNFIEDETFIWWHDGGKPLAYLISGYNTTAQHRLDFSFNQIEDEVDPHNNYSEREKQINLFHDEGINKIRANIEILKKETAVTTGKSLKEIMDSGGKFEFPEDSHISPILIYLMSNGYIDEYYHPYISHFIEGSLSEKDMSFVMSVLNRQPLPHDHELTNIGLIHKEWISIGQYSNTAILNFDLLNWLLQQESCEEEISLFIGLLRKNENILFIDDYRKLNKNQSELIRTLGNYWPEVWDYLYDESLYGDEILAQYASLIIQYLPLEKISMDINKNKKFSKFMSIIPNLYEREYMENTQDTLVQVIDELNVKFDDLRLLDKLPTALKATYQSNSYTINSQNLKYVIQNFGEYETFPKEAWESAQLTTILSSAATNLKNYIDDNLETYLNILNKNDLNIKESEDTIIMVLKNKDADIEMVKNFIRKQESLLSSIEDVPEIYWDFLLEEQRIVPTWLNVQKYLFYHGELEDTLTTYLNEPSVYATLKKIPFDLTAHSDSDDEINISHEILYRNELTIESYSSLLEPLPLNPDQIEIDKLSEEKINYLIDKSLINFASNTFSEIQSKYPKLISLYVEKHLDLFFESLSDLSIEDEAFVRMIQSPNISQENKANLIQHILTNYSMENHELGQIIVAFLSEYQSWPMQIDYAETTGLLKGAFSTSVRIRALTPVVTKLSREVYKEIESTFSEPYNQISQNDTRQRSFRNFTGLKPFVHNVQKLFSDHLGTIKDGKEKVTIYYKK